MKICVAQTRPFRGDVQNNIKAHEKLISMAVSTGADIIVFPELSLTGYEPGLAESLATDQDDKIFDSLQEISDTNKISIAVGMPVKSSSGILITMIIFQPHQPRLTYSKQYLHEDEFPYFINGEGQVFLTMENLKIAPAICYESLLPEHSANASKNGTTIYIASVAKSASGVEKAFKHFPEVANKYAMTVLMANAVGPCDNFESAGKTSIWNSKGILLGQLNDSNEGILIIDTNTQEVMEKII
ncbi:MAG: carbon-nitrogen hydrolase family protein [Chitinophagaceae bacterium]